MRKNRKIIFRFLMLVLLMFNVFVPRNTFSVEANEISRVSLTDGVIVDIAAGTDHNLALDQQGNLWAWGRNDYGQVGNGTTIDQPTPVQIMRGHKFKKISAGNNISAAIDIDNYLYVWGASHNGLDEQLFSPTLYSSEKIRNVQCNYNYTLVTKEKDEDNVHVGYVHFLITGNHSNFKETKISTDYTTSILSTKFDYKTFSSPSTSPASCFKIYNYNKKIIAADGNHYICMYQYYYSVTGGRTFHYGMYSYNFLVFDDGSIEYIYIDKFKDSNYLEMDTKKRTFFETIDLSYFENKYIVDVSVRKVMNASEKMSSTAYFVSKTGNIYSIGDNYGANNLLGSGESVSLGSSTTPVEVQSDAKFTKVSAGENHVLALDENGKVHSWGNNSYGQLGHDDTTIRTIPTMIKTFDETKSFNFNAFSNEVFSDTFYQYGGSNYLVVEDGSKGTFDIDKDTGKFTYTPNENEYGEDTALISISYNGVVVNYQVNVYIDRKPVFTGGTPSFNVECGESYTGVAPATDPDNHNLTYSIVK